MANDFYQATGNPATRSEGRSAAMRAEFRDIQDAFDKMPTLTGNAGKAVVVNGGGTALGLTAGTLALAGNFATVGAFALALTLSGATNVTLPTTGTLATLAGTETLLNKTLNSPTLVAPALGTPASGNLANCTGLPAGSIVGALPAANFPALTGDVTTPGASLVTTLATVNSNVGTFGSGSNVGTFTVDGKGRITAAASIGITAPAGALTGSTLAANVTASSLTSVGTISSGTWQGTVIAPGYGGTGSSSIAPVGSIIFAAASGVYGYDNTALQWNNTHKSLGIGVAAPANGDWRVLIRSQGLGKFPFVIQSASGTSNGFYVGENTSGHFNVAVADAGNSVRVLLNSAGTSYFTGGALGVNTAAPVAFLDVQGPGGLLNPGDVLRIGSANGTRFLRFGVLNVDNGGGTINQAPFIQSNYNNDTSSSYQFNINPIGGRVLIGGFRQAAALLDVQGNVAVSTGGYFYSPYNGSTDTGTVRAGIQMDGDSQSVNFYTGNTYRGGMGSLGQWNFGGYIGVGAGNPATNWTSLIQVGGDITLRPAVSTVMWNAYYDGAWRYVNNGALFYWRSDTGHAQLGGAPAGTAGAAVSPYTILDVDLTTRRLGLNAPPAYLIDARESASGGAATVRIANTGTPSGSTQASVLVDIIGLPYGYGFMAVNYNGGSPYMQIAQGGAVTGPLYLSAINEVQLQAAGATRLTVNATDVFTSVRLGTSYTGGNYFGNLLLQGLSGTAGYVRTSDATPLFLGVNNGNFVGITGNGSHLYPVGNKTMNLGGSGNLWASVDTAFVTVYGSTSGSAKLGAQATAANNTCLLPNSAGTLLIGGTQLSAALGADVALNNISLYFNGPAIALPAGGTYLLIATLTIQDIGSAANLDCRLWNGSSSIGSARGWIAAAGGITTVTLIGLSAGGVTITSQAADITSTGGALRWNLSGNQADCRIIAFKVAS